MADHHEDKSLVEDSLLTERPFIYSQPASQKTPPGKIGIKDDNKEFYRRTFDDS